MASIGARFLPLLLVACSAGRKLDLGSNDVSTAPSVDTSAPSIVGSWKGYVETIAFSDASEEPIVFPDGSDMIAASFVSQADGSYTGTITFGAAAPPPAPTDPNVAYPPGYGQALADNSEVARYFEGFPYTAAEISFDGTRLRFGVASDELWRAWCELQTQTYPYGSFPGLPTAPAYTCAPRSSLNENSLSQCFFSAPDGGSEAVDCGKANLCAYVLACNCSATSCTSDPTADVLFDMQLSGIQLDGTSAEVDTRLWLYGAESYGSQGVAVAAHFTRDH